MGCSCIDLELATRPVEAVGITVTVYSPASRSSAPPIRSWLAVMVTLPWNWVPVLIAAEPPDHWPTVTPPWYPHVMENTAGPVSTVNTISAPVRTNTGSSSWNDDVMAYNHRNNDLLDLDNNSDVAAREEGPEGTTSLSRPCTNGNAAAPVSEP
ncbi:hypothetical protein EYF80_011237 [Liparis tanakae]|uniref:Uncharacterized protein n=1 Tax=Liparis tanakae TaxID=230148 RepID=A0A4Z2ILW1_9TELE|nr:hypothetical protein EYF80_011237 [Liparis tanakae]